MPEPLNTEPAMPLIKSPTRKAFTDNLKAELAAKKPKKQALAIAYSVQRKSRAKTKTP